MTSSCFWRALEGCSAAPRRERRGALRQPLHRCCCACRRPTPRSPAAGHAERVRRRRQLRGVPQLGPPRNSKLQCLRHGLAAPSGARPPPCAPTFDLCIPRLLATHCGTPLLTSCPLSLACLHSPAALPCILLLTLTPFYPALCARAGFSTPPRGAASGEGRAALFPFSSRVTSHVCYDMLTPPQQGCRAQSTSGRRPASASASHSAPYSCCRRRTSGPQPGCLPMERPSTSTTGIWPAKVPVQKASSAEYTCGGWEGGREVGGTMQPAGRGLQFAACAGSLPASRRPEAGRPQQLSLPRQGPASFPSARCMQAPPPASARSPARARGCQPGRTAPAPWPA